MALAGEIGNRHISTLYITSNPKGEKSIAMATCQALERKPWRANGTSKVSAGSEDLFYSTYPSASCWHASNLGGTLVVACPRKGRKDLGSTFLSANCAMIVTECAALLRSIPIVLQYVCRRGKECALRSTSVGYHYGIRRPFVVELKTWNPSSNHVCTSNGDV